MTMFNRRNAYHCLIDPSPATLSGLANTLRYLPAAGRSTWPNVDPHCIAGIDSSRPRYDRRRHYSDGDGGDIQ